MTPAAVGRPFSGGFGLRGECGWQHVQAGDEIEVV
jgi:hypothetical protein